VIKSSLTALDFAALLREGLYELEGLRLQKAWMLGEVIVARFREPLVGDRVLIMSPQVGVFETGYEIPRGQLHPRLARALRELRGARLVAIRQIGLDRVVALTLESRGWTRELVVEWVREGNVLVLDEEGVIVAVLRSRTLRDRRIRVGEPYKPPPPRGLDPLSLTSLDAKALAGGSGRLTASAYLVRRVNAPGELIAEALYRAGVNPRTLSRQLDASIMERVIHELKDLYLKVLRCELEPCIAVSGDELVAAYPLKLRHLELELRDASSFREAVDEVYTRALIPKPEPRSIENRIYERARQYESRARELRAAAKSILENLERYEEMLEDFRVLRRSIEWSRLLDEMKRRYPEVLDVDAARLRVRLSIGGVEISLDASCTAARNASRIFEEAKELERKAERAREVAAKTSREEIWEGVVLRRRRERKWYEGFRHFTSSEGFLVIGGKDAGQNEAIVRKYMEPDDIFMHADVYGGPVVVIKSGGKSVGNDTLIEAAQFAATYSRAWEAGLIAVDVYWVRGRQVSKKPPAGEYLKRGAFMVYGKRNYIKSVKLELAVGVKMVDGEYELLYGPPSAVMGKCEVCVVVEPGRLEREEAAERIASLLAKPLRARGLRIRLRKSEILELMPRGGFHISRVLERDEGG